MKEKFYVVSSTELRTFWLAAFSAARDKGPRNTDKPRKTKDRIYSRPVKESDLFTNTWELVEEKE